MRGQILVGGRGGEGRVLFTETALSFWGGVDPLSGEIIDSRHPLLGSSIRDAIVCLPGGRGSCTGSQVVLELLLNGAAPRAIVLREREDIMCLGALVAREFFGLDDLAIVRLEDHDFERLRGAEKARVDSDGRVVIVGSSDDDDDEDVDASLEKLELTAEDEAMLASPNKATRAAMRIVVAVAKIQGARELLTVRKAHIDAVTYIGQGGFRFAERLVGWGGKVRCETTTNAMSCDRKKWRELGFPEEFAVKACALGEAYLKLGCAPSFTCAPYNLSKPPQLGDDIGWSESNAVAYANSCLGARTQKNADYMDACIAITGRAPRAGVHLDEERRPTLTLDCSQLSRSSDDRDVFFATLGYLVGGLSTPWIPLLTGLEHEPSVAAEHMKGFAAAFATTSAAPMFHIDGHTPEASTVDRSLASSTVVVTQEALARSWESLVGVGGSSHDVQLVAIGSPHAATSELEELSALLLEEGGALLPILATTSRQTLEEAERSGLAARLRPFGVVLIADTCWCMLNEPVIAPSVRTIVTNSAKYAHYAPGLVGRPARLSSLRGCVAAARQATFDPTTTPFRPKWLPPHQVAAATRRHYATAVNSQATARRATAAVNALRWLRR